MTTQELKELGARLTGEDVLDVLDGFFHGRHRVGGVALSVECRRIEDYSIVELLEAVVSDG